jgi:NAD(P)-dependent dehydrogenase (short-subunit alcohol dehydrogenase family)
VQAGAHREPVPPMRAQHLRKPGMEHEMLQAPRYEAPDYVGSGKLEDMVAIVTGGDSGIGRAVAVLFAREGADVAVLHLAEERDARETVAAIEREGRRGIAIAGDVKDPAFCERAVRRVLERFGRLDILVNNAAFQEHTENLEDLDDEHLQETLQTNIGGYFHMARAALPHLPRGGCISTPVGDGAVRQQAPARLFRDQGRDPRLHQELGRQPARAGIRVNCVAPGPVWTPLNPADKQGEDVAQFGAKERHGPAGATGRNSRPRTSSWHRPAAPATSTAWCCPSWAAPADRKIGSEPLFSLQAE